jgi:hypothetical protein
MVLLFLFLLLLLARQVGHWLLLLLLLQFLGARDEVFGYLGVLRMPQLTHGWERSQYGWSRRLMRATTALRGGNTI